ncbi:hypothetical protein SRABI128_00295 [Microbacterium sp. Bi128]|nr:hypothetical protein SRABI128_00295 [Microbacterium sp. Bi128]
MLSGLRNADDTNDVTTESATASPSRTTACVSPARMLRERGRRAVTATSTDAVSDDSTAAPVIARSSTSSPIRVVCTRPRENTTTRSHRPSSSTASVDSTTTATPDAASSRRNA